MNIYAKTLECSEKSKCFDFSEHDNHFAVIPGNNLRYKSRNFGSEGAGS